MAGYCFVIQPFDDGEFDARYTGVIEPTLRKLGVEPYRADKDAGADIIIDAIEENIQNSLFCLADITTDNPNVWYEVGYAFACDKRVILICADRREKYPFDIQHRSIIKYKTNAPQDFLEFEKKISDRVTAILSGSAYHFEQQLSVLSELFDSILRDMTWDLFQSFIDQARELIKLYERSNINVKLRFPEMYDFRKSYHRLSVELQRVGDKCGGDRVKNQKLTVELLNKLTVVSLNDMLMATQLMKGLHTLSVKSVKIQ